VEQNFNHKIKLAGKDLAQGFMRRNRELRVRKSEPTTVSRILAFNRIEVTHFYDNFLVVLEPYKFVSHRIFNVHERGFSCVQKPASVISCIGQNRFGLSEVSIQDEILLFAAP
jgi:hypothetical protein